MKVMEAYIYIDITSIKQKVGFLNSSAHIFSHLGNKLRLRLVQQPPCRNLNALHKIHHSPWGVLQVRYGDLFNTMWCIPERSSLLRHVMDHDFEMILWTWSMFLPLQAPGNVRVMHLGPRTTKGRGRTRSERSRTVGKNPACHQWSMSELDLVMALSRVSGSYVKCILSGGIRNQRADSKGEFQQLVVDP